MFEILRDEFIKQRGINFRPGIQSVRRFDAKWSYTVMEIIQKDTTVDYFVINKIRLPLCSTNYILRRTGDFWFGSWPLIYGTHFPQKSLENTHVYTLRALPEDTSALSVFTWWFVIASLKLYRRLVIFHRDIHIDKFLLSIKICFWLRVSDGSLWSYSKSLVTIEDVRLPCGMLRAFWWPCVVTC